ncbi:hypothetical protein FHT74_007229 [Rhizobium sp. BK109]|jgi:hypothetical protein|nr:hypothetical protein [Rhizobium sp. BK112]MBB4183360.1 hypothetical protein [Rhizobium sp. BK109]
MKNFSTVAIGPDDAGTGLLSIEDIAPPEISDDELQVERLPVRPANWSDFGTDAG